LLGTFAPSCERHQVRAKRAIEQAAVNSTGNNKGNKTGNNRTSLIEEQSVGTGVNFESPGLLLICYAQRIDRAHL
jgi:hypothetical protein